MDNLSKAPTSIEFLASKLAHLTPISRDSNHIPSLYAMSRLIRSVENELLRQFDTGNVHGTIHTAIGQEVQDVLLTWSLSQSHDRIFTNHRNHGQVLAWGANPTALFAEIFGRESGIVGGFGGSQHLRMENLHSSGVQAGLTGIAVGSALSSKVRETASEISVAVIGDGTLGEGIVYEAMNMASIWESPTLFVVLDNEIAQTTPSHLTHKGDLDARFRGFGLEVFESKNPADASEFQTSAIAAIKWVRENEQPAVLHSKIVRIGPHSKGDDTRTPEQITSITGQDPLISLRSQLDANLANSMDAEIDSIVSESATSALSDPLSQQPILVFSSEPSVDLSDVFPTDRKRVVESLNAAHHLLLGEFESIFIGQDINDPYGGAFKVARGITTSFPNRTFSSPISEAGMTGLALGFALEGTPTIVEMMFGDFVTLAADQLVNQASKLPTMYGEKHDLNFVLRLPSGGGRGYGPTHSQSLETMFLGLPNIAIVAPSSRLDNGECLKRALIDAKCPVIFVENKRLYPERQERKGYESTEPTTRLGSLFPLIALRSEIEGDDEDGLDVTIVTYGGMVTTVEQSVEMLMQEEISVDILAISLLSPLDKDSLINAISKSRIVVVVEEGIADHGFGTTVVSTLAESSKFKDSRFLRIGSAISPIPAAPTLESKVLPEKETIVRQILDMYQAI